MKADIYRFAGEFDSPEATLSPLMDRGIGTLQFKGPYDNEATTAFQDAIGEWIVPDDEINFNDTLPGYTHDVRVLIDRFEDITAGIHPGDPTVKLFRPETMAAPEDSEETVDSKNTTAYQLQTFYQQTDFRPHINSHSPRPVEAGAASETTNSSWDGYTNKVLAYILLPENNPTIKSLLHELGHCGMKRVGLSPTRVIRFDGEDYLFDTEWNETTKGLTYTVEGQRKGAVIEEAVADGLGSYVNRKLVLAPTRYNDEVQALPEIMAPYLWTKDGNEGFSTAAPSAVALELIAQEIGLPAERYFKLFADYANAGVENMDARQEVAESVYHGTRGRLTLAQIEELPYPEDTESIMALLWAVEDALDIPDHQRYSDLFFT